MAMYMATKSTERCQMGGEKEKETKNTFEDNRIASLYNEAGNAQNMINNLYLGLLYLCMQMNIHHSTLMPCSQQNAAVTASMLDVLQRVHHIRDEE